ncbi:O-acyltransferase like protein-like [Wyeomyia smithii]|uniref:O-acyltransferase like protein-like n=1 Tax=Wyeomyia smithii TaxID=174621 RepID=UPI002467FE4B|nr:O-acyltransferase like protein-like [Wyeomyia smithii]XP_055524705.1 O-acyltransferase like protein-like [Wyeomyia smithii]XP_055524706.1 O-acyltransferase like protein-like [Wyeomyia smithii]XP_055524707.1 O-acyltransferase like protein-like [Wyeomyia smithii]XP_055524708.1 O-acyltransferase like protein-like [Wyeomyia smithii]XP_055524709.1 O-acyltransferase like protein-like [Wyeomyia smithii]XP_055524710.1 O-acyltransferase like protein-like [Wyeomyia smithii]XP_055524711.1 O-acyltran
MAGPRLVALFQFVPLVVSCQFALAASVNEFVPLADYVKLPKLFVYDDFGDCRDANPDGFVYCVVHARILPNTSSELWLNISHISDDFQHFDHARLERGVCIESCETTLQAAGTLAGYDWSPNRTHASIARSCISAQIQSQYGLQIESDVNIYHCYTDSDMHPTLGILEALFYLLLFLLATLVLSSTAYDMREFKRQGYPVSYYLRQLESKRDRLWVAFSIPRNLHRLKDTVGGSIRQDLQFLEAFRCIVMLRVIILHVILAHIKLPQTNTFFIEGIQHRPETIVYIAEFQNYVQTFLSISGMLMTVNFLEHIRKNPDFDLTHAWKKIRSRLYRIVPAYAFVIFLQCALMKRMIDGPLGQHFIGESQDNCRRWWWANLLFINNYIQTEEPCLIQSWYLAVDMQLFIYGVTAMMLIWRWPHLKEHIFRSAFVCALVLPTVASYVFQVTPVMTAHLKNAHHYSRKHDYQYDIYFPFHQNIGVYSFGMLAGFVYHHYRDSRKALLNSTMFRVIFHAALILVILSLSTVYWVLVYRNHIAPILQAIYSTFFKQSWGILTTLIQLALALFSVNSPIKRAFSHPVFGVAGKLSYSIYLIHFTVIELVYGGVMGPVFSNERVVVTYLAQVLLWTLVIGLGLTVLIELPAAAALKELLEQENADKAEVQEIQLPPVMNPPKPVES